MSFDDLIRVRCDRRLKARLQALADADRRELSQLIRLILEDVVSAAEQDATSPTGPEPLSEPLTAEERAHLEDLARRRSADAQGHRPPRKPGK